MTIIWIIIFTPTPEDSQSRLDAPIGLYKTSIKYLCRGECSALWRTKVIPVQSGSAEDQRFSLDDDTAARVFTITITDLRPEDGGRYWCGVKRPQPLPDLYTEILLLVEQGSSADSVLIHSTPSFPISTYVNPRPTQLSPSPYTRIALGVLVLFCNWRKRQDVQSSIITQRNSRRDVDVTDYENDAPGNQQFMTVYQSLNPSTNQLFLPSRGGG
ncbi:hypothetical protein SRHO_G00179220 [Serrasalmus rhombeus]